MDPHFVKSKLIFNMEVDDPTPTYSNLLLKRQEILSALRKNNTELDLDLISSLLKSSATYLYSYTRESKTPMELSDGINLMIHADLVHSEYQSYLRAEERKKKAIGIIRREFVSSQKILNEHNGDPTSLVKIESIEKYQSFGTKEKRIIKWLVKESDSELPHWYHTEYCVRKGLPMLKEWWRERAGPRAKTMLKKSSPDLIPLLEEE